MRIVYIIAMLCICTAAAAGDSAPTCLGVDASFIPDRFDEMVRDAKRISVPPLEIILDSDIAEQDSAYVHELLEILVPSLLDVLGPPTSSQPLYISLTDGNYYSPTYHFIGMDPIYPGPRHDDDDDGFVDEDPYDGRDNDRDGQVDEDPANSVRWDNTFVHELTHAFHRRLYMDLSLQSWLGEGLAEAGEFLVGTHAEKRAPGRRLVTVDWADRIAASDALNARAGNILGGISKLIQRFDFHYTYRAAGPVVILPVLAELASHRDDPHPLHALTNAFDDLAGAGGETTIEAVIDRAWRSPVDGVYPPSRWMRSRAVANFWPADGYHIHLVPRYPQCALNPEEIISLVVQADDGETAYARPDQRTVTVTAVDEAVRTLPGDGPLHELGDLSPGAYRVHGTAFIDGFTTANDAWILMANCDDAVVREGGAIAVIFVGPGGDPIDPPSWHVDGRVLETVPGGAIVAPYSVLDPPATLNLEFADGDTRNVTLAGEFGRVVPIFLDSTGDSGATDWSPYNPSADETVTVRLRRERSALCFDQSPVECCFRWGNGGESRVSMIPDASGVLVAELVFPAEHDLVNLFFEDDQGFHGTPYSTFNFGKIIALAGGAPTAGSPALVRLGSASLVASFERPVAGHELRLDHRMTTTGIWLDSGLSSESTDDFNHAWNLTDLPDHGQIRLVQSGAGIDEVLFVGGLGLSSPTVRILDAPPFPNPTPDGLRWTLDLDMDATFTFTVHDLRGRTVHGPVAMELYAGRREIFWDGRNGGRRLPAGVYLLRLAGAGRVITRTASLMPRRWRP